MTLSRGNTTQFVLLGLLSRAPMTGYAIKKAFDEGVNHFWNVSYGQIYPELKRLVAKGHAGVREEKGSNGRARKVYRITPKGRRALRAWLAEPPTVRPPRSEVALKLCFGACGRLADQISHLQRFGAEQDKRLELLREIERQAEADSGEPDQIFSLLTLRMGIALSEAMAQWARDSVSTLKNHREKTGNRKAGSKERRSTLSHAANRRVHAGHGEDCE